MAESLIFSKSCNETIHTISRRTNFFFNFWEGDPLQIFLFDPGLFLRYFLIFMTFQAWLFLQDGFYIKKKREPTSSVRFSCLLTEVLDTYADGTYAGTIRLSEAYYDLTNEWLYFTIFNLTHQLTVLQIIVDISVSFRFCHIYLKMNCLNWSTPRA